MDEEMFLGNNYQAGVVRGDLSRAIPALIPEIVEESELALDETFKISPESGMHTLDTPSQWTPVHSAQIRLPFLRLAP
jgi:hypothetical protein